MAKPTSAAPLKIALTARAIVPKEVSEGTTTLSEEEDTNFTSSLQPHPDWRCNDGFEVHDFFISYRVATDAPLATELALALRTSSVHTYLDKYCLIPGQKWEDGFLQGLLRAKVVLLVCSVAALQRVLVADKMADNMLLEWEITLDMVDRGIAVAMPLFIGTTTKDTNNKSAVLAFDGWGLAYPDEYHVHKSSPRKRTVKQTMQAIFSLQGKNVSPLDVVGAVQPLRELLDQTHGQFQPLTDEEKAALREYLDPVDINPDRERLRAQYMKGTRKWLLEELMSVRHSKNKITDSRVTWLSGGAGTGKSVLAAQFMDALEGRSQLGGAFICRYDDVERRSPMALVNTLIYSLAMWRPAVGRFILDILDTEEEVRDGSVRTKWEHCMVRTLNSLERVPESLVFVVDGLDECSRPLFRSHLLSLLSEEDDTNSRSRWSKLPSFVSIVVTARPEDDISIALTKAARVKLIPSHRNNVADVERVVVARLRTLAGTWTEEEVREVVQVILRRSGGVFRVAENLLDVLGALMQHGEVDFLTAKYCLEDAQTGDVEWVERTLASNLGLEDGNHDLLLATVAFGDVSVEMFATLTPANLSDMETMIQSAQSLLVENPDLTDEAKYITKTIPFTTTSLEPHLHRRMTVYCLRVLLSLLPKLAPFTTLKPVSEAGNIPAAAANTELKPPPRSHWWGNTISQGGFTCDWCSKRGWWGTLYHCSDCGNFDLCPTCYHLPRDSIHHDTTHRFRSITDPDTPFDEAPIAREVLWHDVVCDSCGVCGWSGGRYTCAECRDFDLCKGCWGLGRGASGHDEGHPFYRFGGADEVKRDAPVDRETVPPELEYAAWYVFSHWRYSATDSTNDEEVEAELNAGMRELFETQFTRLLLLYSALEGWSLAPAEGEETMKPAHFALRNLYEWIELDTIRKKKSGTLNTTTLFNTPSISATHLKTLLTQFCQMTDMEANTNFEALQRLYFTRPFIWANIWDAVTTTFHGNAESYYKDRDRQALVTYRKQAIWCLETLIRELRFNIYNLNAKEVKHEDYIDGGEADAYIDRCLSKQLQFALLKWWEKVKACTPILSEPDIDEDGKRLGELLKRFIGSEEVTAYWVEAMCVFGWKMYFGAEGRGPPWDRSGDRMELLSEEMWREMRDWVYSEDPRTKSRPVHTYLSKCDISPQTRKTFITNIDSIYKRHTLFSRPLYLYADIIPHGDCFTEFKDRNPLRDYVHDMKRGCYCAPGDVREEEEGDEGGEDVRENGGGEGDYDELEE
ncbi:hypothetical protein HDV00_001374 [Rhizophlyctis rosea]|nr:hypothetical protein HDV00_001374 [Rhizophlyctis rosea]